MIEQRRARIPGNAGTVIDDIVPVPGRKRDGGHCIEAKGGAELGVIGCNPIEHGLVEPNHVDLVHRQDDLPDTKQADDERMPPGLRHQSLAGIDQEDGEVGRGRPRRHVAGVLLMARCIRDNEAAAWRGDEAIGDIDGDALFPLCLQPIDQQGQIDLLARRPVPAAVARQGDGLVVQDEPCVVQQTADQGRFAIIHAPAGDEAEQTGFCQK